MAYPAQASPQMTLAEFLEWEEAQEERWELIDGRARMMAGGSVAHNTIVGNVFGACKAGVKARPDCRVFVDSMKLLMPSGSVAYPDVMIACGTIAATDRAVEQPLVLVEVVSPATEAHDRGAKWLAYQGIPSLAHYVLVAQDRMLVEVYHRLDGNWQYQRLSGPEAILRLDAVGMELPLATIWDGV
ncbi:MAG: Uma2 family endonuclease [Alphaproteobacteria bacterium]|nr:Uma2 family endonuclease [Alphaproteobacteria bacterium]